MDEMKKQKPKHHKGAALAPRLRIKTAVDFGEEGIPLERFDEVMQALKRYAWTSARKPAADSCPSRSTAT
jgi:hypothetical protein